MVYDILYNTFSNLIHYVKFAWFCTISKYCTLIVVIKYRVSTGGTFVICTTNRSNVHVKINTFVSFIEIPGGVRECHFGEGKIYNRLTTLRDRNSPLSPSQLSYSIATTPNSNLTMTFLITELNLLFPSKWNSITFYYFVAFLCTKFGLPFVYIPLPF